MHYQQLVVNKGTRLGTIPFGSVVQLLDDEKGRYYLVCRLWATNDCYGILNSDLADVTNYMYGGLVCLHDGTVKVVPWDLHVRLIEEATNH